MPSLVLQESGRICAFGVHSSERKGIRGARGVAGKEAYFVALCFISYVGNAFF